MRWKNRALCLEDFEPLARKRLPRPIHAYVCGGAEDRRTQAANREAFDAWEFQPRVLMDTTGRSQATSFLGSAYQAPFGIAPMGVACLAARQADRDMASAAAAASIPMILSGAALTRLEEVASVAPDAWFQMYVPDDRAQIGQLMKRAGDAGFRTLVLTVDFPVPGGREHYVRNGFQMPLKPGLSLAWQGISHPGWLFGTALRQGMPRFENTADGKRTPVISSSSAIARGRRDALDWEDVAWIRSRWQGRLVIKGILAPEDAAMARDAGVDAIVISNHGGRQLDRAVPALRALPAIAAAVPGFPLAVDGGFRRGVEVLMALALGASMVLIGRPFLYAAAVAGRRGIDHAIGLMKTEVDRGLALLGCRTVADVGSQLLRSVGS